ncbi:MAG: alpha/beta hydrolase [Kofleriaceae bacterium]
MIKLRPLQRVQARIGPVLGWLPERLQRRLAGPPVVVDGATLAPDMQMLLKALIARGGIMDESPGKLRKRQAIGAIVAAGAPVAVAATRDLEVDGLRARHYANAPGAPLVVFLHGGGFVFGDLETHDRLCRMLCKHAGVHVLAIEYRLAPEFPFPAGVEDADRAWRWARVHASELGADPERIAIAGDSAGGNLAAGVAQTFASTSDAPVGQLLIYPAVDYEGAYPSKELFAEGFFLTRAASAWFREQYVETAGVHDPSDVRLRPSAATALANQPPAIVVTAGFDPLRDEGEAYAAALARHGSSVVVRRFAGLIHGFANMTGISRSANEAVVEIAGMLRMLVANRPAVAAPALQLLTS